MNISLLIIFFYVLDRWNLRFKKPRFHTATYKSFLLFSSISRWAVL